MGLKSSYQKWFKGESLGRKESMDANCYLCNGESAEIKDDCLGEKTCPLYPWSPWGKVKGQVKANE
jgi:hypothetical protein